MNSKQMCLVYLESTQTKLDDKLVAEIGAVFFNDGAGYHATTWGLQSKDWVEWYNLERLGIDYATSEAMEICSMFGN